MQKGFLFSNGLVPQNHAQTLPWTTVSLSSWNPRIAHTLYCNGWSPEDVAGSDFGNGASKPTKP